MVVHNLDIPSSDERLRALKQHSDLMGQLNLLTDNTALVQIRGLHSLNIDQVRQLCTGLTGVSWVDIPANLSEILSQYRNRIVQLLTLSIGAVIIILVLRFKQQSWRAFLPTVLGLSLTVAVLSLFGYSFSLFMALALILLLGLGFDYGIFMSCSQQEKENLAAIAFAALTTFLSFGILTLSNTPALKIFGLTVAIGQCFIVTLTILFRKKDAS